jgi:hypothetical protein
LRGGGGKTNFDAASVAAAAAAMEKGGVRHGALFVRKKGLDFGLGFMPVASLKAVCDPPTYVSRVSILLPAWS